MIRKRVNRIELAIELPTITVAYPPGRAAQRRAERLGERPLRIHGREVGHVAGNQSGLRVVPPVRDRGPGEVVGILALDHIGPEPLQSPADRSVSQQQPIVGAEGHMRRLDPHGGRAAVLLHPVCFARQDHQVAMLCVLQNMSPLGPEVGPNAAADRRPALGQVAEQALGTARGGKRTMHQRQEPTVKPEVPGCNCRQP